MSGRQVYCKTCVPLHREEMGLGKTVRANKVIRGAENRETTYGEKLIEGRELLNRNIRNADRLGMSYGKYMAMKEMQKKG